MAVTIKTEQQMYDDVETYVKAQLPDLTNWNEGSPERAIAQLIKLALSMIWKPLYIAYKNIWPTTADYTGLRNWYEQFALAWLGESEEVVRANVLAKFRERSMGTAQWYEDTAITQFAEVTAAEFLAGRRGAGTADLLILRYGNDVLDDTLTAVQAYFDNPSRKICTFDLKVITRKKVDEEAAAAD
jgi:hypothetical protein